VGQIYEVQNSQSIPPNRVLLDIDCVYSTIWEIRYRSAFNRYLDTCFSLAHRLDLSGARIASPQSTAELAFNITFLACVFQCSSPWNSTRAP
jgi:hypothetical protein